MTPEPAGPLTEAEVAEIARLASAATPEPWSASGARRSDGQGWSVWAADGDEVARAYSNLGSGEGASDADNAAFIAASRTAIARLLADRAALVSALALQRGCVAAPCPACGVTFEVAHTRLGEEQVRQQFKEANRAH